MIIALYIAAAVIMAVGSLYFAWRNRDFRKFLAGAFFVSSGILFYLYLADVSVPLLGTSFVETPQISGGRSIVHFIFFLLCFCNRGTLRLFACQRLETDAIPTAYNQKAATLFEKPNWSNGPIAGMVTCPSYDCPIAGLKIRKRKVGGS